MVNYRKMYIWIEYKIMTTDVRKIRQSLNLTQIQFAERFGFNLSTLRCWEQNNRIPSKATRVLLRIIERAPKIVEEIMRSE